MAERLRWGPTSISSCTVAFLGSHFRVAVLLWIWWYFTGNVFIMESDKSTFTNFSRGFIAIVKVYYFSIRTLLNAVETKAKAKNLQAEALDKKVFLNNFVLTLKNHLINQEVDDIYVCRSNFFVFDMWNSHLGFCITYTLREMKRKYACHIFGNLNVYKRIDNLSNCESLKVYCWTYHNTNIVIQTIMKTL